MASSPGCGLFLLTAAPAVALLTAAVLLPAPQPRTRRGLARGLGRPAATGGVLLAAVASATEIACALGGALLLAGCGAAILEVRTGTVAGAALGVVGLGAAATCVSTAAVVAAGTMAGRLTALSQVARQAGGTAIVGAVIGRTLSLECGWFALAGIAAVIVVLDGMLVRPTGEIPG